MPLKLIPPGRRRNVFWLARGTVAGVSIEASLKTTDATVARLRALDLERDLLHGRAAAARPTTFLIAADAYMAWRNPSRNDRTYIEALKREIGHIEVAKVTSDTLVAAALALYPTAAAATRNRHVMRPGAAVIHHAAANGHCPHVRVRLFREPRPVTRAVTAADACRLIDAAPAGNRRALLLWLFTVGTRISDTLRVQWEDLDLMAGTARFRVSKADRWMTAPLLPELVAELASLPGDRRGQVFRWCSRQNVYRWLRPLADGVGLRFTPHMARHSLGAWLNQSGAGLRTIMDALGHQDVKSSIRYQSSGVETVRAEIAKIGLARVRDRVHEAQDAVRKRK